jgi:hypothetical protein
MTHTGTNTIRSSVPTTNHNHILSGGRNKVLLFPLGFQVAFLGHQQSLLVGSQKFLCGRANKKKANNKKLDFIHPKRNPSSLL